MHARGSLETRLPFISCEDERISRKLSNTRDVHNTHEVAAVIILWGLLRDEDEAVVMPKSLYDTG